LSSTLAKSWSTAACTIEGGHADAEGKFLIVHLSLTSNLAYPTASSPHVLEPHRRFAYLTLPRISDLCVTCARYLRRASSPSHRQELRSWSIVPRFKPDCKDHILCLEAMRRRVHSGTSGALPRSWRVGPSDKAMLCSTALARSCISLHRHGKM
jgi:hypothetical protein